MMARTHAAIGLGILTVVAPKISLPVGFSVSLLLPFFFKIIACIIGSLSLDLDMPESYLSRKLGTQYIGRIMVLALVLLVSYLNFLYIINPWLYIFSGFIAFLAIFDYSLSKYFLPIVAIEKAGLILVGLLLLFFNYKLNYGLYINIIGVIFVLMGILSHRGITHSLLGVSVFALGALLLSSGHSQLPIYLLNSKVLLPINTVFIPFFVGLISHLVADLFADSGVPLFYPIPKRFVSPISISTNSVTEKLLQIIVIFYLVAFHLKGYVAF